MTSCTVHYLTLGGQAGWVKQAACRVAMEGPGGRQKTGFMRLNQLLYWAIAALLTQGFEDTLSTMYVIGLILV